MNTASRARSIILLGLVAVSLVVFAVLTFQVNTVKSEVRLAERRIIALRTHQMMLETEFETRASQRQLSDWNAVEFGYRPPRAAQFMENERELAMFGAPRAPGAPDPIRVAVRQDDEVVTDVIAAGSPLAGQAFAAEAAVKDHEDAPGSAGLAPYLGGGAARIAISARVGAGE